MKKLAFFAVALVCGPSLVGYAADAKTTWVDKCAKCHGTAGKGDTKMGKKLGVKDYTDAKTQAGFTDAAARKAIKAGIKDKGGATRMKPNEDLSDADAEALVAFVRALKK